MKPILGITMGDAAGVGPEIIDKALAKKEFYNIARPIVIGDASVIEDALKVAKIKVNINSVKDVSEAKYEHGTIEVIDLKNIQLSELKMGQVQAMAGKASVKYVEKAIEMALENKIDAIVTAPLNKEAMNLAGYDYAGHTEILAHLTKTKDYAMMLVAGQLRVIHVTTHVSMRDACELIKKERVLTTIRLTDEVTKKMGVETPKIAVSGFNPHAGESGLFGKEEIEEITPAIESAKKNNMNVIGPMPPDTVFLRASRGEYDAVVAMYHDQGHIPVKMLGFESGVNVTIGLPIIRTSVDHGTAYRRAGLRLGTGDPTSLEEAMKLAVQMSKFDIEKKQAKK
ncbi:4-hydroxythreonine-4-phosphate dehydrogenase PdxA [Candidatus Bathyarchaeota archaeon RBG_13_38_9]|nr:MAG: 4-hydroxythreonine-4-phosphate dehydrogenase PdxA [Candidatus Bathyarchaeota archaeon RBG_13_38_9]